MITISKEVVDGKVVSAKITLSKDEVSINVESPNTFKPIHWKKAIKLVNEAMRLGLKFTGLDEICVEDNEEVYLTLQNYNFGLEYPNEYHTEDEDTPYLHYCCDQCGEFWFRKGSEAKDIGDINKWIMEDLRGGNDKGCTECFENS
jgi:hypothetical protein